MLIDILRMPPAFGIPLDRHQTIATDMDTLPGDKNTVIWQGVPLYRNRLHVGAQIVKTPHQLYKAIHVSGDDSTVFETIFSVEDEGVFCLYTKVISSQGSRIAISLPTISHYQAHRHHLFPLSHFLVSNRLPDVESVIKTPLIRTSALENVIPAIFDLNTLQEVFTYAMMEGPQKVDTWIAGGYYPIYHHLPHVMEALISGRFSRSPFGEFVEHHPTVKMTHDKWFCWERIQLSMEARGMQIHINHQLFDDQVLNMMKQFPTRFHITASMSHAIDGLTDVWITSHYEDDYAYLTGKRFDVQRSAISSILYECTLIYCRLYQIDVHAFMVTGVDKSTITISKNIYDEIEITFCDHISDRYVCFYSSFPVLALSTLAAGWYN